MRPNRSTAARTAASASARLVTSSLTVSRSFDCPRAFDNAVAVPAGGHDRVAGRQGGLGEVDAHATAGARDEPDLPVTHDLSLSPNARCGTRSRVLRPTFSIQSTVLPSSFPDRDVRHGGGRRGAMPVLLDRRDRSRHQPISRRVPPTADIPLTSGSGRRVFRLRAPGSNVTLTPRARAGSGGWNRGATRTAAREALGRPLTRRL